MSTIQDIDLIIKYLQEGTDLPAKYRDILFPSLRKECELTYKDKIRKEEVLTDTDEISNVPLQVERSFLPDQGNINNWTNLLIFGDNLQILKTFYYDTDPLVQGKIKGKVKLIYIDPPFATEKEFSSVVGQKAYADRVSGAEFIEFLRRRLIVMRELLTPDGFICVHLDYRKKHYIKVIMDEIFGESNFRNEIAVNRVKKSIRERKKVRKLNEEFDTILLYANSELAQLLPPTRVEKKDARWHAFDAPDVRNGMDYDLFGRKPNANRHWTWEEPRARTAVENYKKYVSEHKINESIDAYCTRLGKELDFLRAKATTGTPEYYISASDTVLCNNLWNDISAYSFSNDYPTEKSEVLLARIIGMTTEVNDLVMDCFAGSGTTLAVAEKMQRRWVGCDIGKLSLYTIQKRMLQIAKSNDIFNPKKKYKKEVSAFSVVTAGLYDLGKVFALSADRYRKFVKTLFEIEDTNKRSINGITIDGEKRGAYVKIYPYWDQQMRNADIDEAYIEDLHRHIGMRIKNRFYIVAPANSVAFLNDYYELEGVKYYFLKIPYQVIRELHNEEFKKLKQPQSQRQINNLTEAIGFHFKRPLEVESKLVKRDNQLFIAISKFLCDYAFDEEGRELKNFESLSLIMIDDSPRDNSDKFIMSSFYYAKDLIKSCTENPLPEDDDSEEDEDIRAELLERQQLLVPINSQAKKVRVLYIDIYGDEFSETLVWEG